VLARPRWSSSHRLQVVVPQPDRRLRPDP
jgi:hypothetical protein